MNQQLARLGILNVDRTYRIGPAGNTRVFVTTIMPSGKLIEYAIVADPDNR